MTMQVNIGGTYKDVSSAFVNVGGVWKTANNIYTNIGGVWKDASLVNYGEYELLADYIVPSNTTSYTFSGLNIGKGDEIVLVVDAVNTTTSDAGYRLFFNGNTTLTNYYYQYIEANGSTIGSGRSNSTELVAANSNNQKAMTIANIKLTNSGYMIYQTHNIRKYGLSSIHTVDVYCTSTFTSSSITSITITSQIANCIGTNSRFQLYKIGGAS